MTPESRRRVSVILPVRNRFDLAARAIRSVVEQTHRPLELIVVDDASEQPFAFPESQRLDDLPAQVIRLEANSGPGAAREAGRLRAAGDFLAYLDSDDYWAPRHLEAAVAALGKAPEKGMAYSAVLEMRDGAAGEFRRWSDEEYKEILPALLWGRPWHTSACVWRRETADAIGPWLPLWHFEDYEHDCRGGCLGTKLVHLPEPTCFVQADAPGRQSDSPVERRRVDNYGVAILSMSRRLRRSGWADDAPVRERSRELLVAVAAKAADLNMKRLSAMSMAEAWKWPQPSAKLVAAGVIGVLMLGLSLGGTAARFFRWAKPEAPRQRGLSEGTSMDGLD